MLTSYAEKTLATILSYGAAITTVIVISNTVTDPVNAPKLVSLGVVGAAALGVLLATWGRARNRSIMTSGLFVLMFLVATVNATVFSASPFSQNLYGVYGRNNGLIAYIFLACVFLSAAVLSKKSSFESVAKGLLFAGIVNIIYCGWVIFFGDFIGWNNPYGNILGTFGNPNFIGAFLGIFLSAYIAYAISSNRSPIWKWSLILVVPVTLFEIIDSNAIQGRVVAAGGIALVVFSYLRYKVSKAIIGIYSFVVIMVGIFSVLGALQFGPLTQYIYKTSVSLRGQYWLAGWNAGERNPFNGLGMDALGDSYRRVRDPQATVFPGVNTVVNAAHNVFMDMFAFGGWPLFIAYTTLVAFSAHALLRTFIRLKTYDGTFVAIAVAWIGYQVQSIISINQIGLAIWGWLLGGVLIAYERITRTEKSNEIEISRNVEKPTSKNPKNSDIRVLMISFVSAIIGLVIALPPFVSDTRWSRAMAAQSLEQIEKSMAPSYFNPHNSNRFAMNIRLLEQSNLPDLAYKYAILGTKWNPESYDLWRTLYFISKSSPKDKVIAKQRMQALDPHNSDVTTP